MRISEKAPAEYSVIARIIFWAQKMKYGESLVPSKIWGRSPKLLYGLQALYRAIDRKSSPLEPALRVLINVLVSQINHCSFCLDIGTALLQKRGVAIEKALAIANFETDSQFTERERAALAYAEGVTRYEKQVDQPLFERLRRFFNDDEIIELTALIAYQNLSSKFNSALDIPSQGFCVSPIGKSMQAKS
jgi:AhpD family alkylhydroperoxidase